MSLHIAQSAWKGFRIHGLTPDHVLDVWPTEDYPRGREALELSNLWGKIRNEGHAGLLLLGCDVAADPDDYEAISAAAFRAPAWVHTGMVKLWPSATKRRDWMWSHRSGSIGNPVASQIEPIHTTYFSLGFVYLPNKLLDLAFPAHDNWRWGEMDVGLSEIAYRAGIGIRPVYDARPKHLHFTEEHNLP